MSEQTDEELLLAFIKRYHTLRRLIKADMARTLGDMHLSHMQLMTLKTLSHQGPCGVSELGERLGLSASTVSGLLDRLEAKGVVERTRDESDRRKVLITLTPEARKMAKRLHASFKDLLETLVTSLTRDDMEAMLRGMNVVIRQLEKKTEEVER